MTFSKNQVLKLLNKAVNESSQEYKLLTPILDFILKIDFELIDLEKSLLSFSDLKVELVSNKGKYCDIYYEVTNGNNVDIQIGYGGEYLYNQMIRNDNDMVLLRRSLEDIFYRKIIEKITYCGEKIIQSNYTVFHDENFDVEKSNFSANFGNCWFKKKKIRLTEYSPWIG